MINISRWLFPKVRLKGSVKYFCFCFAILSLSFCSKPAPKVLQLQLHCFQIFQAGFELTYRDSQNTIHFSFFTIQFFPPSLKITIPKQSFFLNGETNLIFLVPLEKISISTFHALWKQFCYSCICTKSDNISQLFKETT